MERPLMNFEEWCLAWLAGEAAGVTRGKVSQSQLEGAKRRVLSWGIDTAKVELTIATQKAPPRIN